MSRVFYGFKIDFEETGFSAHALFEFGRGETGRPVGKTRGSDREMSSREIIVGMGFAMLDGWVKRGEIVIADAVASAFAFLGDFDVVGAFVGAAASEGIADKGSLVFAKNIEGVFGHEPGGVKPISPGGGCGEVEGRDHAVLRGSIFLDAAFPENLVEFYGLKVVRFESFDAHADIVVEVSPEMTGKGPGNTPLRSVGAYVGEGSHGSLDVGVGDGAVALVIFLGLHDLDDILVGNIAFEVFLGPPLEDLETARFAEGVDIEAGEVGEGGENEIPVFRLEERIRELSFAHAFQLKHGRQIAESAREVGLGAAENETTRFEGDDFGTHGAGGGDVAVGTERSVNPFPFSVVLFFGKRFSAGFFFFVGGAGEIELGNVQVIVENEFDVELASVVSPESRLDGTGFGVLGEVSFADVNEGLNVFSLNAEGGQIGMRGRHAFPGYASHDLEVVGVGLESLFDVVYEFVFEEKIGNVAIRDNELDAPGKDGVGVGLDSRGKGGGGHIDLGVLVAVGGIGRGGGCIIFCLGRGDVNGGSGAAWGAIGLEIVEPMRFPGEFVFVAATGVPEAIGGLKGAAVIAFLEAVGELGSAVATGTPVGAIVGIVGAGLSATVIAAVYGDTWRERAVWKAVEVNMAAVAIGTVEETFSAKLAGRILDLAFLVVSESGLDDEGFFADVARKNAHGFAGVEGEEVGEKHLVAEIAGMIVLAIELAAAEKRYGVLDPIIVRGGDGVLVQADGVRVGVLAGLSGAVDVGPDPLGTGADINGFAKAVEDDDAEMRPVGKGDEGVEMATLHETGVFGTDPDIAGQSFCVVGHEIWAILVALVGACAEKSDGSAETFKGESSWVTGKPLVAEGFGKLLVSECPSGASLPVISHTVTQGLDGEHETDEGDGALRLDHRSENLHEHFRGDGGEIGPDAVTRVIELSLDFGGNELDTPVARIETRQGVVNCVHHILPALVDGGFVAVRIVEKGKLVNGRSVESDDALGNADAGVRSVHGSRSNRRMYKERGGICRKELMYL